MSPDEVEPRSGSGRAMSDAHKAALARGREQARHVRAYLDVLAAQGPRRGRARDVEALREQLAEVEARSLTARGVELLELVRRRIDLERELRARTREDLEELRRNFVAHAADYARRKGIPRQAFREAGVPVQDLRDAGIR